MTIGGNKKLREFFLKYDMFNESQIERYKTNAAEYYRKQILSQRENKEYEVDPPSYDAGRLNA